MTISNFDRSTCRELSSAIEQALAVIAAQHGVSIKTGSGSFAKEGNTFTLKLELATKDQAGNVQSKEATDFIYEASHRQCPAYRAGLTPEHLGATFSTGQGTYELTGFKRRAKKYPLTARCTSTGRGFKFPINAVTRALGVFPVTGNEHRPAWA